MYIPISCEREDCWCNEDGHCVADMGILIDSMGECTTYYEKEDDENEKSVG